MRKSVRTALSSRSWHEPSRQLLCRKETGLCLCFHDLQLDDGTLMLVGQERKGQETARAQSHAVTSANCRAARFLQQWLKGLAQTQPGHVPQGSSDLIIAVRHQSSQHKQETCACLSCGKLHIPSQGDCSRSMGRKSALLLRRKSPAFLFLGWDTELGPQAHQLWVLCK